MINRTKQSIEIDNFCHWIVSTQSRNGGGIDVADQSNVTSLLRTIAPLKIVQLASNKI